MQEKQKFQLCYQLASDFTYEHSHDLRTKMKGFLIFLGHV
jgi:hypothetical protein